MKYDKTPFFDCKCGALSSPPPPPLSEELSNVRIEIVRRPLGIFVEQPANIGQSGWRVNLGHGQEGDGVFSERTGYAKSWRMLVGRVSPSRSVPAGGVLREASSGRAEGSLSRTQSGRAEQQ